MCNHSRKKYRLLLLFVVWFVGSLGLGIGFIVPVQAQPLMRLLLQGNNRQLLPKTQEQRQMGQWHEQLKQVTAQQEHLLKHEKSIRDRLALEISQYQHIATTTKNAIRSSQPFSESVMLAKQYRIIASAERCVALLRRVQLAYSSQYNNLQNLRLVLQQMLEAQTQLRHLLQKNYPVRSYAALKKARQHIQNLLQQSERELTQTRTDIRLIDTSLQKYQSLANRWRRELLHVPTEKPVVTTRPTTSTRSVISLERKLHHERLIWQERTLQFEEYRAHIRLLQVRRDDEGWERDALQLRTQLYQFKIQEMTRRLKSLSQQVKGGFLFYRPLPLSWHTFQEAWMYTRTQWQQGWPMWQYAFHRAKQRWQDTGWGTLIVFLGGWLLLWGCLRLIRFLIARPLAQVTSDANQATLTKSLWRLFQVSLTVLDALLPFFAWIIAPFWMLFLLFGSHEQPMIWLQWTWQLLLWYVLWILVRLLFHRQAQHDALLGIRTSTRAYTLLWVRTFLLFALLGGVMLSLLEELSYPVAFWEIVFACVSSILTVCFLGILAQRDVVLTLLPSRTFLERMVVVFCFQFYALFFLVPLAGLGLFLSGYQNLAFYLLRSLGGTFLCLVVFTLLHEILHATLVWFFGFSSIKVGMLRGMDRERASKIMRTIRFLLTILLFTATLGMILVVWQVPQGFGALRHIAYFPLFQSKEISISLVSFARLAVLIAIAVWVSQLIPQFLQEYVYPNYNMTEALQYAISSLLRYVFIAAGCLLGLQWMGVGWGSITLFLGIIAIGIGFGLQDIFGNFISGLIILFGRPFAVGDFLEIGSHEGRVKEITVRSTTIQTPIGRMIVVPNSVLLNSQVINWSLHRTYIRDRIDIQVEHGVDFKRLEQVMLDIARNHVQVLPKPEPIVRLRKLNENSMEVGLSVTIRDPMTRGRIFSDIRRDIVRRFKEEGIHLALSKREILLSKELEDAILQKLRDSSTSAHETYTDHTSPPASESKGD